MHTLRKWVEEVGGRPGEVWYKYDIGKKKKHRFVCMHVYSLKDRDLDSNTRDLIPKWWFCYVK